MLLRKNGTAVSAAAFRCFGTKLAEVSACLRPF